MALYFPFNFIGISQYYSKIHNLGVLIQQSSIGVLSERNRYQETKSIQPGSSVRSKKISLKTVIVALPSTCRLTV